jgi:hypothetical protein
MEPKVTRQFQKEGTRFIMPMRGSAPDPSQLARVITGERPEEKLLGLHKKEKTMRYIIIAAAAATIALAGAANAQVANQIPATQGNTASDYGESPSGSNIGTTQPSGGKSSDELGAATGNLSGSQMGASNMNGPNRDGQPPEHHLQNGDTPEMSH